MVEIHQGWFLLPTIAFAVIGFGGGMLYFRCLPESDQAALWWQLVLSSSVGFVTGFFWPLVAAIIGMVIIVLLAAVFCFTGMIVVCRS